ncbi:hypothetical protein AV530_008924 [Patagioenas fasciata monilis]|uniref:Uncharacterized protein n=1 Tax=Patagioenas fasciata monilis TaxID=372326 RepID=A0A1V4JWM5_PATFA|nr:hypothetical protein AV530_008924 [Patagioenas fasciata monilis]
MEVHSGADIHLQPMEDPMPEQVDAPEGGCDPVESPCWSRLLVGVVTPWGTYAGTLFLKDCTPWNRPMLEQFVKNCSPWEGPMLEKFMEDCLPWVEPHTGAGEEHEEEGAAETTCDELTATPIPHPPVLLWERR